MGRTIRDYQAIVWRLGAGASAPPHRLTIAAPDEAEARRFLVEQFGDQIRCSIWNQEDTEKRWPWTAGATEVREYKAIVWAKDPATPGHRLTVAACSPEEAKERVQAQFTEEITCTIWNEEDADRTR